MYKTNEKTWVIGIGGSDTDGIGFLKVHGTKEKVKVRMVSLLKKIRDDNEGYDYQVSP